MSNTTDYIKYLTNRANNGDTKAQYSLGVAYYEGKIIAKNLTLSQKWFSLAAQNGNLDAEVGDSRRYADRAGTSGAWQSCRPRRPRWARSSPTA